MQTSCHSYSEADFTASLVQVSRNSVPESERPSTHITVVHLPHVRGHVLLRAFLYGTGTLNPGKGYSKINRDVPPRFLEVGSLELIFFFCLKLGLRNEFSLNFVFGS